MFGSFTIESLDRTEEFRVTQRTVAVGRSGDNDLSLPFPTVSKHHACISADDGGCRVADLGSVNGTFVNGVELAPDEDRLLADGDVVRIGAFQLRYHAPAPGGAAGDGVATAEVEARPGQTVVLPPNLPPRVVVSTPQWTREFPLAKAALTIGRDADNDIVVPLVAVSRRHAVLERRGADVLIRDLGSTNGVTVGGRRVSESLLRPGDHASLGNAIGIQYLGAVDFAAEFVAEAVRRAAGSTAAGAGAGEGSGALVEGVFFDDRALIGGATISFVDGKLVCSKTPKLGATVEGAVVAMGHVVESRDPYTAGHERRVAELAAPIAREMGLRGERLAAVRLAALIHDIGKMSVPAEILSKPGRLNTAEFNLIKEHPRAGYTIIEGIEFGPPVATMVLQHHERPDGSGYPQGLAGPDILLEARIIAVADVAEAMASHRPYRPALGAEAALEELTVHAGTRYDADAVAACVRLFQDQGFEFTE